MGKYFTEKKKNSISNLPAKQGILTNTRINSA